MREKKTEVITIRITSATKNAIVEEAQKREWTPSKMAEKILTSWAASQQDAGDSETNVTMNHMIQDS